MIQERQGSTTYGPAAEKMLAAFSQSHEKYNGWFEHPDNPTFDWRVREDGSIFINSWTGRTVDEILKMGGLKRSDISLKETYPGPTKDTLDLLDIAIAKGMDPRVLESFGLQSGYPYKGRRYVKVSYFNADGTQHTKVRIRKAIEGKYKQIWDEDTPGEIIPYGLNRIDIALHMGYLLIGEGESDGWACWFHELPYLGIPGADMRKTLKHLDINLLPPKIYILLEPDQKQKLLDNGQSFYKNIHQTLCKNGYTGEIFCIDFKQATGHKDPSELHIALWKEGKTDQFEECIRQAIEQAIPANDMKDEIPAFAIQDARVLEALVGRQLQSLYALAPEIAEMEEIEQDRIRLAAHDVWGKDFPMREFNGLLKSAKQENERKKQGTPVIFSVKELMSKQFPPIDYIVPDILPRGLIVLAGKQKIGKSWIDLNLALAVASGGKVFGKYDVSKGDVLYMALEDNERRLQERVKVLMAPGSEVPDGLDIVTEWPRMDAYGLGLLEQWISSHPNARLVIIDPWVVVKPRVKNRHGETGYDAEYEAFKGIKELADKYSLCILVQFHLRKAVAEDYVDTINATTGVTACADGFLVLQRLRGEEDASLRGTGRDFKDDVDMVLKFKGGIWSIPGDANPAYYKLNAERRAVIDILNNADGPMEPHDIANILHLRQDNMRQLLKRMKEADQVTDTGNGYRSLIPTTPKDDSFPGWKERERENENSEKSSHGSHASHGSHGSHGSHAVLPNTLSHASHAFSHAPMQGGAEPVEATQEIMDPLTVIDVTGVTTVTTVTDNSQNEPLPISLMQEYRDIYQELQKVDPEKLAPLGTLQWYVPDSDLPTGQVSRKEYSIRLQALYKSNEVRKIRVGLEEMQRILQAVEGR